MSRRSNRSRAGRRRVGKRAWRVRREGFAAVGRGEVVGGEPDSEVAGRDLRSWLRMVDGGGR